MPRSIVDSDGENSSDGDLRALGKIRLEDAKAEEIIRELIKEFEEYGRKSSKPKEKASKKETSKDSEHKDSFHVEKTLELAKEEKKQKSDDTLSKKLLKLFREFCEKLVERNISDDRVKAPYLSEKRRKRLIVEALLNMLKRLSLNKERNLRDLLDEQIVELQKALEIEHDPKMRKAIQERLGALMQLKMHLSYMKDIGPSGKLAILLMQCAIAEGHIGLSGNRSHGFFSEAVMRLSKSMGKVMDVGDIKYNGVREEIGSMSASYCVNLAAHVLGKSALDSTGISAMARSFSILDGIGLSKSDKWLVVGQAVDRGVLIGLQQPESMFLSGLVRAVDNLVSNIVTRITQAFANVMHDVVRIRGPVRTGNLHARNIAGDTTPRQERDGDRSNRSHRSNSSAQDRDSYHHFPGTATASGIDMHVRANVQCKIDGERIERTECRESRGVSFVDMNYGTYFVRSIVCTYQSIVEKVSGFMGNSPSSELSGISVERVQQNQVVVETHIMSR